MVIGTMRHYDLERLIRLSQVPKVQTAMIAKLDMCEVIYRNEIQLHFSKNAMRAEIEIKISVNNEDDFPPTMKVIQ